VLDDAAPKQFFGSLKSMPMFSLTRQCGPNSYYDLKQEHGAGRLSRLNQQSEAHQQDYGQSE
jgi:hypothetical protein